MTRLLGLAGLLAVTCLVAGLDSSSGGPFVEAPQIKEKDAKGHERLKEPTKDEEPQRIETLLANSKKHAVRRNGVQLDAKVEVKKNAPGDVLLLTWSIDYTGPRFPLHILKPSLSQSHYNQTYVMLYVVDEKGIAHPFPIHPQISTLLPSWPKEAFLTVNKDEVAKGTIKVPLKESGARAIQIKGLDIPPARLFVQLRHAPWVRGRVDGLDAWTGNLQTPVIHVPMNGMDKNE